MKKTTLLTHLSYDENGAPYIGVAIPLSSTKLPKGRMTGVFGRQAALMASTYWWKKIETLYKKPLSKVELYIESTGKATTNQALEDLNEFDVINIMRAQQPLTQQLNEWVGDFSKVETKFIGDRDFFRRIIKNPEIINQLFEVQELSHIKAFIWPVVDPTNNMAYISMITFRSMDDVVGKRVFNYDGNPDVIPYKL